MAAQVWHDSANFIHHRVHPHAHAGGYACDPAHADAGLDDRCERVGLDGLGTTGVAHVGPQGGKGVPTVGQRLANGVHAGAALLDDDAGVDLGGVHSL